MGQFKFKDRDSCYKAVQFVTNKSKEYQQQPKPNGIKCHLLHYDVYNQNNQIVAQGSINTSERWNTMKDAIHNTGIGRVQTTYYPHPIPCSML
ncbi:MAG: hypothetical protein KAQ94_02815 [Arcobacteraceae bacterium]|nr:hypothetical protein [Arcobacteraceae bacterium]